MATALLLSRVRSRQNDEVLTRILTRYSGYFDYYLVLGKPLGVRDMTSLLDSIILGTTLLGSVGAAFMMQKTALDLLLRTMDRRR